MTLRAPRLNMAEILDQHLLPRVKKPSRYLGNEVNSVGRDKKDPRKVRVRIALTFPDLYDIGLGNLGLHILYAILNQHDWCWAERVYAPAVDMERLLREDGLPLFALESKDSLDAFDGIAITLQSELNYTNILNIIDLAGMPLRTENRRDDHWSSRADRRCSSRCWLRSSSSCRRRRGRDRRDR